MPRVARPGSAAVESPEEVAALEGLRTASRVFESLLYREMIRSMVASSTEGGFFGTENGGETWQDLFESGLADMAGSQGRLGIADAVFRQFESAVRRQAKKA